MLFQINAHLQEVFDMNGNRNISTAYSGTNESDWMLRILKHKY